LMHPRVTSGTEKAGTRSQPAGQAVNWGFCHTDCHQGPVREVRAAFSDALQSWVSLPTPLILICSLPLHHFAEMQSEMPNCINLKKRSSFSATDQSLLQI
jgi:hypothetical protein